jgi:hypothetical protein
MTREEAMVELNTFKKLAKSESGEKALDMAIKTLQLIPDIETVLHNSSYITNDEYEDEVIEVELIQRILNKVKEASHY